MLLSIKAQINLIPDSEFDQFDYEGDWFYSHRQFNNLSKSWKTPIPTSPDLYGPGMEIPEDWLRNGFGDNKLHDNNHIAGITVYGCDIGKPHCREYLMVKLDRPIQANCPYVVEMLLSPLRHGRQIMSLDLSLVDSLVYFDKEEDCHFETTHSIHLPKMRSGKWTSISDTLHDLPPHTQYLIIGNFKADNETFYRTKVGTVDLGYYYIDKVKLWQLCKRGSSSDSRIFEDWLPLSVGKTIILNSVHFDFDDDQILEESKLELDKLIALMQTYPEMVIEVTGYTDSDGTVAYNMDLSKRRAMAVAKYLLTRGIEINRISYQGNGESKPVDSNETEIGRAKNRRVEFEILKL